MEAVDPTLAFRGFQRLNRKYDKLLSNFAFNCNLRHYSMVKIAMETQKIAGRNFTPSVIEPSFGIGRIMYCMFEHSFYVRADDNQKSVFRFTPLVAPIKCTIFPLVNDAGMNAISDTISRTLMANGLSAKLDATAVSVRAGRGAPCRGIIPRYIIHRCGIWSHFCYHVYVPRYDGYSHQMTTWWMIHRAKHDGYSHQMTTWWNPDDDDIPDDDMW